MSDPGLTSDELVVKLRAACTAAGSVKIWADQRGLLAAEVSQILGCRKGVTLRVALALGVRPEVRYFPARRIGSCST